jgi:predicted nucleic acid-binding protein
MMFWDSSALVPLLVEQPASRRCRELLRADPAVAVWCLTRTEILSAIWCLTREAGLAPAQAAACEARLDRLAERWTEVDAVMLVRDAAERALRVHGLRAVDAMQLGAALVAVDHRPRNRQLVSLDEALVTAASAEGFHTIRPS